MTHYEATQALVNASRSPAGQRKLIRLARTRNKNDPYRPGDFGYPAPVTGSLPADACGPNAGDGMPQALAANQAPACFKMSGVNLQSGNDQLAMEGLNTRFDIYANGFSSCTNYPADQNVRKGYTTVGNVNWCNASPSGSGWPIADPAATALPVDLNMVTRDNDGRPALNTGVAMGSGTWDCATYWSEAHPVRLGHPAPPGCTGTATISRYKVYQYEIDSHYLYDRSLGAETGAQRRSPDYVWRNHQLPQQLGDCSRQCAECSGRRLRQVLPGVTCYQGNKRQHIRRAQWPHSTLRSFDLRLRSTPPLISQSTGGPNRFPPWRLRPVSSPLKASRLRNGRPMIAFGCE